MKTLQTVAFATAALLTSSGVLLADNNKDPIIPVGSLTAFPTVVQTGTKPLLTWSITYPSNAQDVVTISGPGTVTPKEELVMEVRIIGASVQATTIGSNGKIISQSWVPTECLFSYNNGSYLSVWFNTQDKVQPNQVVLTKTVYPGQPINFGGRYKWNNTWSSVRTSTNSSGNVVALVNGSKPPLTTPLYQQPTIESFLLPYLNGAGNIKIGPRDVIYLMELTHTDINNGGFDIQDLVILATFKSKGNNGHGNNIDGVDVSNPGQGGGGPNGGVDPSGSIDDEKK